MYSMKIGLVVGLLLAVCAEPAHSQVVNIQSPNQKIGAALFCRQNAGKGECYLTISYAGNGNMSEIIPRIDLGLTRNDQDFSRDLKFLKAGKTVLVNEQYSALHGKKSMCSNSAHEVVVSFENPGKAKLNIIIRVYNDGVTFRYEFPE